MNKQVKIRFKLKEVVTGKDIAVAVRGMFSYENIGLLVLDPLRVEGRTTYFTAGRIGDLPEQNVRLAFGDDGEEPGLDLNMVYLDVWVESWEHDCPGIFDLVSVSTLAQGVGAFAEQLYADLSELIKTRSAQKA